MSNLMKYACYLLFLIAPTHLFGQAVIKSDSTFNLIGYHTISLYPGTHGGGIIKKDPIDNKYVVRTDDGDHAALLKYKRNGTLDSGFNNVGYLLPQPPYGGYGVIGELFIDNQDRIINSAWPFDSLREYIFMRTNPNGSPDLSFGPNGAFKVPNSATYGGYLFQLPDKSFLTLSNVFHLINSQYYYDFEFCKFKSNFTIDSSFGVNGMRTYVFGFLDFYFGFNSIQFYNDGRILFAPIVRTVPYNNTLGYDYDIKLMRFKPNGDWDSTFGINGSITPKYGTDLSEGLTGIMLLNDNKIIGYGEGATFINGGSRGIVTKYAANGGIDSSFGKFGRYDDLNFISTFFHAGMQKDGKIICGGGRSGYNFVRLREDGYPDLQFGPNGIFRSPFTLNGIYGLGGFPFGVLLENDTTMVVTGNAFDGNESNNVTTARYKIAFQPQVTGVKTNYCIGSSGSGTIINMPLPGSDTLVTVLLDNVALSVNGSGQFNFTLNTPGQHILVINFSKGSNTWKETITINVLNPPAANAGQDAGICSGSITIGTAAISGNSYSWSSNPPGFFSIVATPSVSPTVTTSYFLIVSNGSCISRDTVVVNFGILTANAGIDRTVCPGIPTSIGSAPVGTNTYSWISIPAGFSSTIANPNVTPATSTTYIVTVNNGSCIAKDTVLVTVNPPAAANAGPDKTICAGTNGSVTLGTPAVAGNTYLWTPPTGLNNAAIAQPTATPLLSTVYTLTVTNSTGCKANDNVVVQLIPPFSVTLPDTLKTICTGTSTIIGNPPQAGFSYSWTSIPPGFTSVISDPIVSPSATTVYKLVQTNTSTGCQANASVRIIIDPNCRPAGITVHPNPTNDYIVVQLDVNNSELKYFELIDEEGKILMRQQLDFVTTINVKNIGAGIYHYRVTTGTSQMKSGKVVIIK